MAEISEKVSEAKEILAALRFDAERCNERSALVLLALLDLLPSNLWNTASNPMVRTVAIMEFLRTKYDRDYKPNTRETIRRQTLHQFIESGLILANPDDRDRPVNSPNNCYQVDREALELIRKFGSDAWGESLEIYLQKRPGLIQKYAKARDMSQIPVTLPDGSKVTLTPGGQNVLIKHVLEEFCSRFTPGGQVLYVGDAGKDDPVLETDALEKLGVKLDKYGKLPDLIVNLPARNWLVLMEAASSHGPIDAKRHGELSDLLSDSTADLVFVSCFPSRAELRKYTTVIAWETDAWCADDPSHLVHFDGEKFLGPYRPDRN